MFQRVWAWAVPALSANKAAMAARLVKFIFVSRSGVP
jgi:hypothetical protein